MLEDTRIMSFGQHLEELRKRMILALVVPLPVFVVCLVFGAKLLALLIAPLQRALMKAHQPPSLVALSPIESFSSYVKVSAVATILIGLPWIIYQLWLFVAPGLMAKEKRFVRFLVPLSAVLTTIGLAILYFALLPTSLYFLIEFGATLVTQPVMSGVVPDGVTLATVPQLGFDPASPTAGQMWVNTVLQQLRIAVDGGMVLGVPLSSGAGVVQQYRLSEYIDLVFLLGLAVALAFQLPIVLMLLSWAGIINAKLLSKYRKHAIFGSVVLGAMLPTQDPGSLAMLGGMIYGLYELGIVLMRFVPASRVAGGFAAKAAGDVAEQTGTDGHLGDD